MQQKGMRIELELQEMSYEERRNVLDLAILVERKVRWYVVTIYIFVGGHDDGNMAQFFEIWWDSRTRRNHKKVGKKSVMEDERKFFFQENSSKHVEQTKQGWGTHW